MDVGNRDKVETEKGNEDSINYHRIASDWQSSGASFANLLMGMIPDCKGDLVSPSPLISMVNDSFGPAPALWDHPPNPQSMGLFNSINDHIAFDKLGLTRVSPGFEAPWEPISQFPADSAFIERAARFSCFSTGNITDMVNSFGVNQIEMVNPASASKAASLSKNGGLVEDTKQAGSETVNSGGQEETSLIDTGAQPSSAKRISTKRKRGVQETEQPRQPSGEDVKDNNNGENGKQSSQTSDPPKEEYIHVRARRGQATNSHSLAERVRREKISERMKFLQDLVPGCSKVTGKAVMLDEIINYVQSLQRQVEFLSMKLATVNPRLDFNIESLLAKDQMFAARVVPPIMGFSADMQVGYPQLHPCQPNHPIISSQLTSIREGYKEPTSLVHSLWDDELHNVVQFKHLS